jgi:16S rRNA (cytosine967-C5)-methyltransferase
MYLCVEYYFCRMNYASQYIRSAELICGLYDGSVPLAVFLKQYFAQHKKFGSKDRRYISHSCYCYYRTGHAVKGMEFNERVKLALFLCTDEPGIWGALFEPDWIDHWSRSINERLHFFQENYPAFQVTDIFPWHDELNGVEISHYDFSLSHLTQPDLFLRVRPGYSETVKRKLSTPGIPFTEISDDCIALPNGTRTEGITDTDKEVVVQDHSSQRIAELFGKIEIGSRLQVWDCCAASGGKSILVKDKLPEVILTVSDIRESIIQNLRRRFNKAGIQPFRIFVADLSKSLPSSLPAFDLIVCDAPCTGSGTWGRTPEQLFFFGRKKIREYAGLQRTIVSHIIPHIKPGGYLLYSTCSVFTEENEGICAVIPAGLENIEMKYLKGYDHKADTMFAALFRKTV